MGKTWEQFWPWGSSHITHNGKAARVSGLVACQLLCHYRSGLHLGLRISVLLSTIPFFLRSSHCCDGLDYDALRRHRTSCCLVDRGKLADGPGGLLICVGHPGHCHQVGSTSVKGWDSQCPVTRLDRKCEKDLWTIMLTSCELLRHFMWATCCYNPSTRIRVAN